MPELPEVEAWVRELAPLVSARPDRACRACARRDAEDDRPAPFDARGPPPRGAERRAKNLLFPIEDGELVLRVHLMSAGRIRYLKPGAKGPKRPMFRLGFSGGGELILTEGGRRSAQASGSTTPERLEADLAHLGPDALDVDTAALGEILRRERRQLHPLLRDQRALAGIGRAHANEILLRARPSPFKASTDLTRRRPRALLRRSHEDLERALELRLRGKGDKDVYLIHNRLGEPCPQCGNPIARVDFEEHTIFYCPHLPDGRAAAQGSPPLPSAQIGRWATPLKLDDDLQASQPERPRACLSRAGVTGCRRQCESAAETPRR